MTGLEEPGRLRLARALLVDGRVTVVGVHRSGVDADVVDGGEVLRCRRRLSGWSCPCSRAAGADGDECAHVLAVQMVVGEWLPAEAERPVLRGEVMSGADQWVWAVRAARRAAQVDRVASYAAVELLLEELDDRAAREVACHLAALATHDLGASLDRLELLFVTVMWSWSRPRGSVA